MFHHNEKKKQREREREREREIERKIERERAVDREPIMCIYLLLARCTKNVSLDCFTVNRGYLIMLYISEVDSNTVCQYISTQ